MRKVLFLYTELAAYIVNCLESLSQSGVQVHCVRYDVNPEAPFQFNTNSKVQYYNRKDYNSRELFALCNEIGADIIICSGWIDKDYLQVCHSFSRRIPTVLALDNHWSASLKQVVAIAAARLFIKSRFRYCWVPGPPQYTYAEKLGFKKEEIQRGFYTADVDHFNKLGENSANRKESDFPHSFLYVGRYVEYKGIKELWQAFSEIDSKDWELWCLGTGKLFPEKPEHPKIKHFGFVQPDELDNFVRETSVFILPSHKEPWGVVLHEFAAASYPLICSNKVGAATAFLQNGQNGFLFESKNIDSLKSVLHKCITSSDEELRIMGERSKNLASTINTEQWITTILTWLKIK